MKYKQHIQSRNGTEWLERNLRNKLKHAIQEELNEIVSELKKIIFKNIDKMHINVKED